MTYYSPDIVDNDAATLAEALTRVPLSSVAQKLYNWLSRPTLWQGDLALDSEQPERFNAVLESVPIKPFERDPDLRRLVRSYEQTEDFTQLVADLDAFFTDNALYQESNADTLTATAIKEEDLRLICFERLEPT